MRKWDWRQAEEVHILSGAHEWLQTVCISRCGRYIVAGAGCLVHVWEWKNGAFERSEPLYGHQQYVTTLHIAENSRCVVFVGCAILLLMGFV